MLKIEVGDILRFGQDDSLFVATREAGNRIWITRMENFIGQGAGMPYRCLVNSSCVTAEYEKVGRIKD